MFTTKSWGLALLLLAIVIGLLYSVKRPLYNGPKSDHFDGTHFFYKEYQHSFGDMMKWAWQMRIIKWPKWIDDPPQPKPESKIDRAKIKVTYINHSTLLIQTDGINILTDPVWAKRAGPFGFIGPKRVRNPGTKLEDLPRIDVILMTHDC